MDPIADLLIRIKNAQAVGHSEVSVPASKMKSAMAEILKQAGFIGEIERKKKKSHKSEHEYLVLKLKYQDGQGALSGMRMISKPSRRMYINAKESKPVRSGYGLAIISTPNGILNSKEAVKQNVGGEIICEVW